MPRVLLSVYDKTNLIDFAKTLADLGWELVASGGTEKVLVEAGLVVTPVEQLTGLPEMLGGRVKTLHPAIHAGILMRDKAEDLADIERFGYAPINMVVCNLYPFQKTVAQVGVTLQDAIEQIDIGGVALLRASAKNFFRVITICDPSDYPRVTAALKAGSDVNLALRRSLAVKAFAHTRDYDTAIHAYLSQEPAPRLEVNELPEHMSLGMHRIQILRYGENPHQTAAFYGQSGIDAPLGGKLLGGKELSYNNILDIDAAWRAVSSFDPPSVVIVKHLNPCGIASADNLSSAFPLALASDPVSAFGGVIAVNRIVDEAFIESLGTLFIEAIAAPNFTPSAQALLESKRKNCRILQMSQPYNTKSFEVKSVHLGFLVQSIDDGDPTGTVLKTVTERAPTPEELTALEFAWKAVQHVKSNAIVIAKTQRTVGIGGGLPSRVDAVHIALQKAGAESKNAVLASDAFFPFPDGVEAAIQAGITAIIQPGGSIRDAEVIRVANNAGIAMVFTGIRHFRH